MNDSLTYFENQSDVVSIHGYIYPLEKKFLKPAFLRGADCWGWATWKEVGIYIMMTQIICAVK